MSLFDVLENRMKTLFEGRSTAVPIPFKRLAKKATREMKAKAVKQNGTTVAPALYSVVVSPDDDAVIAPLYQQVTNELVDFLTHEAQAAGYSMPASPIVRFIADTNIPNGKIDVIADVVTPTDLETLRQEEAEYTKTLLKNAAAAVAPGTVAGVRPLGRRPVPASPASVTPATSVGATPSIPSSEASASSVPSAASPEPISIVTSADAASSAQVAPIPEPQGPVCELVDALGGTTYRVGPATTVVGRDEASSDIALSDTNVSRRHAQIEHTSDGWTITDLGSTNGTRVNGEKITEPRVLRNGDAVQMGLISLTFKEL